MAALFTRGSFLKGAEPRGPASRVLLWKQGRALGQWQRGDYDMCFFRARVGSIKRWRVSAGRLADFNQLTQRKKTHCAVIPGSNEDTVKPIKGQQSNLLSSGY